MSEVALICSGLTCLADIPSSASKSLDDAAALNLHCNRLSNLNGLRSIVSITSLNISSNEFSSINLPQLCLLPNLTSLDIAGNNIHSLQDMPFLPSLQTLSIAYNRVQSLDGIESCPALVTLDARSNHITEIADLAALALLINFESLSLSSASNVGNRGNPVVAKYSKNISVLGFLKSLKSVDGEDLTLWPSTDDYHEIRTPKFDLIAQRFRSVISTENQADLSHPEKVTIAVTKTGGRFPHTDVHILPGHVGHPAHNRLREPSDTIGASTENNDPNQLHDREPVGLEDRPVMSPERALKAVGSVAGVEMRARIVLLKHIQEGFARRRMQRCFTTMLYYTGNATMGIALDQGLADAEGDLSTIAEATHVLQVDNDMQTDPVTEDDFPDVTEKVRLFCAETHALREKEIVRDFLQAELKLKNDLAFKTQMVEATEKKRLHTALQLNAEIEKLRTELSDLRVEGTRNLASASQAQLEMEKVVSVRDVEVASLRIEVAELREGLRKSEAERAAQIESLREYRDSADLARSEVCRLSESISLLTAERTEDKIRAEKVREVADSQQRELMSMLKDRVADINRLSSIHESDIGTRMELEKAVESWKARHQTALEMYEVLKTESSQRLHLLEGKCEKQKRSLAEMRGVLKEFKEAKDELGVKYQEAQEALQLSREAEETAKSASEKRNSALNDKLAHLEREFSSLSLHGGKGTGIPQRVIELERKCVDLETNLRVKTTMLDDQNDAMRQLRQRNVELEVQVRESDRDMDALEEDIVGLKKIIADLEMQLDHKSTIEADLRRLVAKLTRDLGSGSIGVNTIKDMLKRSKNDRYSGNLDAHGSDDDFEGAEGESEEGQSVGDDEEYSDEFDRTAFSES